MIAEAEGAAEIGGPGLFGDEGIGSGFDDAAIDVLGAEDAAEACRGFVERVVDLGAGRRCSSRAKAAASPEMPPPMIAMRVMEGLLRASSFYSIFISPGAAYSCTKRARFFTLSTGVSGRMPWPRLKMWPGRPAARLKNFFGARFQFFPVGEEQHGIEISLHGCGVIETLPAFVERDAPVETDDVGSGFFHRGQKRGAVGAEINDGRAGFLQTASPCQ